MSKTVLITGASTGFGRDTAETLNRLGHQVFASMRDVAGRNAHHAAALRSEGIRVVEIDVTDDASVEHGVASVIKETGKLDVIVNNAGIGSAGVSEAFIPSQVQKIFDVNVLGVQRVLRAVLPTMRKQGDGLVINIGSILGRVTFPFFGIYGATKFALEALTESYRYELSQLGIDVTLVQPSNYPTSIFASALLPADTSRIDGYGEIGGVPGKMVGTLMELFQSADSPDPHDVAVAIVQLVDQPRGTRAARTVVGQSFGTDHLNEQAQQVQAQLIEGLGLSFLGNIAKA